MRNLHQWKQRQLTAGKTISFLLQLASLLAYLLCCHYFFYSSLNCRLIKWCGPDQWCIQKKISQSPFWQLVFLEKRQSLCHKITGFLVAKKKVKIVLSFNPFTRTCFCKLKKKCGTCINENNLTAGETISFLMQLASLLAYILCCHYFFYSSLNCR